MMEKTIATRQMHDAQRSLELADLVVSPGLFPKQDTFLFGILLRRPFKKPCAQSAHADGQLALHEMFKLADVRIKRVPALLKKGLGG
ncbi:MAG: hypothetical protein M3329_02215 [Pseudomonadota bacterium]|nr:hypothetical protein [Pseudomonadota bacterium]